MHIQFIEPTLWGDAFNVYDLGHAYVTNTVVQGHRALSTDIGVLSASKSTGGIYAEGALQSSTGAAEV